MRKIKDTLIAVGFIFLLIVLWFYGMIISSDIPVNISFKEFISLLMGLLLFALIFILYYRKARMNGTCYFFSIPFCLWLQDMFYSLKYNYHIYDTILSIVGTVISIMCLIVAFNRFKKYRKYELSG